MVDSNLSTPFLVDIGFNVVTDIFNVTVNISQDTVNGSASPISTSTSRPFVQKAAVLLALEYINYVFLPTVLILGLVGNILNVIIVNTRQYAQFTSAFLLTVLAISDSVLLISQPFNKSFFISLLGIDVRALSDVGCKLYFIIRRSSKMTSSWFVVFLCLERFIVVWFPLRAKQICIKRNIIPAVAGVYVVIIGFAASWSYASQVVGDKCHPDVYDRQNADEKNLFGRMLLAASSLYSVIPMVLLLIFTPLIILKLFQQRKLRRTLTGSAPGRTDSSKVTLMLISIVIAYILLISPITTVHNAAFQLKINAFGDNKTGFTVFKDIAQLLEQINYSINFFLYITSSRKFRKRLQELCSFGFVKKSIQNKSSIRTDPSRSSSEKKNTSADISFINQM